MTLDTSMDTSSLKKYGVLEILLPIHNLKQLSKSITCQKDALQLDVATQVASNPG